KAETIALGLEFGTTPLPVSRRANFTTGGPLFDVPTVTYVPARREKIVGYIALLTKVAPGFGTVRSIVPQGREIVITGDGSSVPILLAASCLYQIWPATALT